MRGEMIWRLGLREGNTASVNTEARMDNTRKGLSYSTSYIRVSG
jgi:hypothetical protein